MQDAAKAEADQAIESLQDATRKPRNIPVASFDRNDPADSMQDTDSIQINIHGVDSDKDPGLSQPGGRQVPRLDSDAGERERLPDEHEAERSGRSQAQHGCAGDRYDRAPRQRARAD